MEANPRKVRYSSGANLILTEQLPPVKIVSHISRNKESKNLDVTFLQENAPEEHMILRVFSPEAAGFTRLQELHARAADCPVIPRPLFMENGHVLYQLAPNHIEQKDFTTKTAKRWSRIDLIRQIEKVKKIVLAVDEIQESGVFYRGLDLKYMVHAGEKVHFWNLDNACVLERESQEAAACCQKNLVFLGRLLCLALLNKYPKHEFYRPDEFEHTNLADQIVSRFCTLLAKSEMEMLLQILSKSLSQRYLYRTPGELAAELDTLQRKLKKETSESKAEKNLDWAVANFLQQNPLYPYVNTAKKTLNVVMVGDGPMRDVFFEQIFASAQMLDTQLRIHIISPDVEDFDITYTLGDESNTPALAKTATITRIGYQWDDVPLDPQIIGDNPPLAEILLYKQSKLPEASQLAGLEPGCVLLFCKLTKGVRSLARELIGISAQPLLVGMSTEQKLDRSRLGTHKNIDLRTFPRNGLTFSPALWEASTIYKRALNIHTYYEKGNNERATRQNIIQTFQDSYSMKSSVRSALAMPYKLFACGLPDDDGTALSFYEKFVVNPMGSKMMDRLIWLEHRSWQAFLIISGWDIMQTKDLAEYLFADGNPKHRHQDKIKKYHPCLCASYRGQEPLSLWDKKEWDTRDASNLDPLDQLSVEMYRMFCKQVKKSTRQEFFALLEETKRTCKNIPLGKLKALHSSFEQLLSRATNAELAFNRTLTDLTDDLDAQTIARFASLGDVVIKRNEYRDFKQSDKAVIHAIPSMLQSAPVNCVYKLFSKHLWDNVASSVFVEPAKLVLVVDDHSHAAATDKRPIFEEFLRLRGLETKVSITYIDHIRALSDQAVLDVTGVQARQVYAAQSHSLLSRLPVICYQDQKLQSPNNSFPQIQLRQSKRSLSLKEMLTLGGASIHDTDDVLTSMEQHANLWKIVQSCSDANSNFYNRAVTELMAVTKSERFEDPASKLDVFASSSERKFTVNLSKTKLDQSGITDLIHQLETKGLIHRIKDWNSDQGIYIIAKDPYCQESINSMFDSFLRDIQSGHRTYRFDVDWLRYDQIYCVHMHGGDRERRWKLQKSANSWRTTATLKEATSKGLLPFLQQLEAQNAIEPFGPWGNRKDGSTVVVAKDPYLQKYLNRRLENLFGPDAPSGKKYTVTVEQDAIGDRAQCIRIKEHEVLMSCCQKNVTVSHILQRLLEQLEQNHFIQPVNPKNPIYDPKTKQLQFAYTSEACKSYMSKAGNALEVFAYHAIRQMDLFDDVKLSVKLRWDKEDDRVENTENEIDLICVKGTRSYFISCKKTVDLQPSYLTEIRYETDRFGLDGTPILLTTAKPEKNWAVYNRAERMGIEIITLRDHIKPDEEPENSTEVLRKKLIQIVQLHE